MANGVIQMDERTKLVVCKLGIPIARAVINQLKDEIAESKTKYDDLALEIVETILDFVETEVCN